MVENKADTQAVENDKYKKIEYYISNIKRLLGFFLLVFLLHTHLYNKPIDVRLLAIPGIVMGIDIKSFLDFRNKNG